MDQHQKQVAVWIAVPVVALLLVLGLAGGFTGLGFILPIIAAIILGIAAYFFLSNRGDKENEPRP